MERGRRVVAGSAGLLPCCRWEPPATAPCLGPPGPFQGTRAVRGRQSAPSSWPKRISGAEGTLPAPCCPLALGLPRKSRWEQAPGGAGSAAGGEGSGPMCPRVGPMAPSHPLSGDGGSRFVHVHF